MFAQIGLIFFAHSESRAVTNIIYGQVTNSGHLLPFCYLFVTWLKSLFVSKKGINSVSKER